MFNNTEIGYSYESLKGALPESEVFLSRTDFGYLLGELYDACGESVDASTYAWVDRRARKSAKQVRKLREEAADAYDSVSRMMLDSDWSDITMNVHGPIADLPRSAQAAWGNAFIAIAGRYLARMRRKHGA